MKTQKGYRKFGIPMLLLFVSYEPRAILLSLCSFPVRVKKKKLITFLKLNIGSSVYNIYILRLCIRLCEGVVWGCARRIIVFVYPVLFIFRNVCDFLFYSVFSPVFGVLVYLLTTVLRTPGNNSKPKTFYTVLPNIWPHPRGLVISFIFYFYSFTPPCAMCSV